MKILSYQDGYRLFKAFIHSEGGSLTWPETGLKESREATNDLVVIQVEDDFFVVTPEEAANWDK